METSTSWIPLLKLKVTYGQAGKGGVGGELTGQVPPLTILSKDKASGMPAATPPEWPDLRESLPLSYPSATVTEERPEFGIYEGRRYVREYTILSVESDRRNARKARQREQRGQWLLGYGGVTIRGHLWQREKAGDVRSLKHHRFRGEGMCKSCTNRQV